MKTNPHPNLITITNDGKNITEPTNYWTSEMAQAGFCLVSTSAGCVRLMVPDSMASEIPDMVKGAKHVVISLLRDHATASDSQFIVSLLIEDKTDKPYDLSFGRRSILFLPSPSDKGKPWTFALWGRKSGKIHKFMERPAFVRYVDSLPCLREYDPTID